MWQIIKGKLDQNFAVGAFSFLGWLALLLLIISIFSLLFSEKSVKGYYVISSATTAGINYTVMADVSWMLDFPAFSTADPSLALSTLERLQRTIPK